MRLLAEESGASGSHQMEMNLSCCVLTTKPNELVKPLHHRMPVVVPEEYEGKWIEKVKDTNDLKGLIPIMMGWSPDGWVVEDLKKKETDQISLF